MSKHRHDWTFVLPRAGLFAGCDFLLRGCAGCGTVKRWNGHRMVLAPELACSRADAPWEQFAIASAGKEER